MEVVNRLIMDGDQMFVIRDEDDARWLLNFLEKYFPRTKFRYRCDSSEKFLTLLIDELRSCSHKEFLTIFPEIVPKMRDAVVCEEVSLYISYCTEEEMLKYGQDVRCLVTVCENIVESSEDIASFFF